MSTNQVIPDFTESHLVGVRVDESNQTINIDIILTSGTGYSLRLQEVERFDLSEMSTTNIIESISIWTNRNQRSEYLETLRCLVGNETIEKDSTVFDVPIERVVQKIERGERVMIEISAVYGAQVIALAGSVSICEMTVSNLQC